MAAEQRKLLEQLMGDQLMSIPGATKQTQLQITDKSVCRSYLCGSCPHDLFTNTKQDMGPCRQAHLPNLREQFQSASEEEKRQWGFEFDYMRDIGKHISDCDRRIDAAQSRLEQTPEEIRRSTMLLKQISDLTRTIEAGIVEVEILSEEGAVNLAVQEFHKLRQVRLEKEDREMQHTQLMDQAGPSGHQKLQVCEVCGAYLSKLDNDRRLADHFFGKMHLGYSTMRREQARLQKELKGRQPPPRPEEQSSWGQEHGDPGGYGYSRSGGGFGRRGGGGGGGYRGGRPNYNRY